VKPFIVAAHSTNTNSFGLRQVIFLARDGTAFKICMNYLDLESHPVGRVVNVGLDPSGNPDPHLPGPFRSPPGEIFELIPALAPPKVIEEAWKGVPP
jgi:hypothetical protein